MSFSFELLEQANSRREKLGDGGGGEGSKDIHTNEKKGGVGEKKQRGELLMCVSDAAKRNQPILALQEWRNKTKVILSLCPLAL